MSLFFPLCCNGQGLYAFGFIDYILSLQCSTEQDLQILALYSPGITVGTALAMFFLGSHWACTVLSGSNLSSPTWKISSSLLSQGITQSKAAKLPLSHILDLGFGFLEAFGKGVLTNLFCLCPQLFCLLAGLNFSLQAFKDTCYCYKIPTSFWFF